MTFANQTKIAFTATALGLALTLAACSSGTDAAKPADAAAATETAAKSSSAGLPDGRIAEGEKLAASTDNPSKQSCIECHGPGGAEPIDPSYPILAGQYADYIEYALVSYRDGKREHAVMKTQAENLNDQQIADLGAYFESAKEKSKLTDLSNVK